jgi:hypothetical protein
MSEAESVQGTNGSLEPEEELGSESVYLEAEEHEPEPRVEPAEEIEPKPPSRLQRWMRTALLWAVGLLGVFALGVAATWFLQVTRLQSQLADLQEALAQADEEMQAQIDALEVEHADELATLETSIAEADLHITLLNALVDVSSARVALAQGDTVGARTALAGTDERFQALQSALGPDGTSAVEAVRGKLSTVLRALPDEPDVADQALGELSANLLSLERSVFSD